MDAAGGDELFAKSAEGILQQIYGPKAFSPASAAAMAFNIPGVNDEAKLDVQYRSKTLQRVKGRPGLLLRAIPVTDRNGRHRVGVFFSREDISSAGLVGYESTAVDGYDPGEGVDGSAYRVMRNILLTAMGVPQNAPAEKPASAPAKNN